MSLVKAGIESYSQIMPPGSHDHLKYFHGHRFLGPAQAKAEARTRLVTALTFVFMLVEIGAGLWFGSMALLADGIHMATHAAALGLAALTYALARRHIADPRFSFGSGKFGDLSAFASGIVLLLLAIGVAAQSVYRMVAPTAVAYGEALLIAVIGLVVNIVSAALLHEGHDESGQDHNLDAAYIHVVTDALTSILAIAALAAGLYFGISFADPLAGLIGGAVIGWWAVGLMRESALVLLDAEDDPELAKAIKAEVERDFPVTICDFHLWRLGPGHRGLILSLIGANATDCDTVKRALSERFPGLSHITVETTVCPACAPHAK